MMNISHLRTIRITVSLVFFAALLLVFLNIFIPFASQLGETLMYFQLFPSILRLLALGFVLSAFGFLLIIILTLLFGRVYCSSVCPLGTYQDMVNAIARKLKSKRQNRFRFSKNRKVLRYTILAASLLFWAFGSLLLINLLDPFANFGKITVSIFQPTYLWLQNTFVFTMESLNIFAFRPRSMHALPWDVFLVSLVIFVTVTAMAAWRGRLFCNTLCPAGSLLGLLASKAYYKIAFSPDACTFCKKCEWVCKAECLDSSKFQVDKSRCISCFNCLSSCPNNGLYFVHEPLKIKSKQSVSNREEPLQTGKRGFLLTLVAGIMSIPLLNKRGQTHQAVFNKPGMIPYGTRKPVTPPGSISHEHFNKHCIACYRCVSACPTKVIVPAFFEYGLKGFMQPKLDFDKSFCNYDCIRCSEVCPTGAITKQKEEDKQVIQTGVARFLMESCVVTIDRTDCGACSEHCPTKAVQMVPYQDGLMIPQITPSLCIGCGACEYTCPTSPYKAIYVSGLAKHLKARAIEEADGPREDESTDFPF